MTEEKNNDKNYWEKYKGQLVMVQLRAQPYVGVTSVQLEPVMVGDEGTQLHQTPLLRGTVSFVEGNGSVGVRMGIQTTDPNPSHPNNKVIIDLNPDTDIGYITVITKSLIEV